MKRKSFLAALIAGLAFTSNANAQIHGSSAVLDGAATGQNVSIGANVSSPWELHIEAPESDVAPEKILRTRVNNTGASYTNYDFFDICNLTNASDRYAPLLWAYRSADPFGSVGSPTLTLMGSCDDALDAEYSAGVAYPMMSFEVRKYQTDPIDKVSLPTGTVSPISTRHLFEWSNNWNVKMRMDGNGDLGIGTGNNAIGARLTVAGESTTSTPALSVMNSSSQTMLHVQNDRKLGVNTSTPGARLEITGPDNTLTFLEVKNSGGTSLLHVDDDGNVGVNSSAPAARLEIKGTGSSTSTQSLDVYNSSSTSVLRVRDDGNIGINDNTPDSRLTIVGANTSSSNSALDVASSTTPLIYARNDGKVAIGTRTSGYITGTFNVKSPGTGTATAMQVTNGADDVIFRLEEGGDLELGASFSASRLSVGVSTPVGSSSAGVNAAVSSVAGSLHSHGVKGDASGAGTYNYGVYGSASDGTNNRGGYFLVDYTGSTGSKIMYGIEAVAQDYSGTVSNDVYGIRASAGASAGNNVFAGYFAGNVYTTGMYMSSDNKLKTDIQPYSGALDMLSRLNTRTYEYDRGRFPSMQLPEGKQVGLIAQEVEQVFPSLVKSAAEPAVLDKNGNILHERVEFKAVNYTGLVPVLVEGIKEQQEEIEVLKQQVAGLSAMVSKLSGNTTVTDINTSLGTLYQNTPNPTNSSTTIRYSLSEVAHTGSAEIVITDAQRTSEYQRMPVAAGSGEIEIKAGTLFPGTYIYSLVVNGKIVDSKKMLIMP